MSVLSNDMISLGKLIKEDIYKIPTYQRGYSWEKSQLEDFWDDLVGLYENPDMKKHFIGLIVVHNDKNDGKNIIDGQQRISTAMILLDGIREVLLNIYKENLSIEDANNYGTELSKLYIGNVTDRHNNPRLIMGKHNKDFFRDYIQRVNKEVFSVSKLSKSNKRIYEASKFFKERLVEYLKDEKNLDDQVDILNGLYRTFLKKFELMYLETDEINEAFIIFETLNARGKELDTSELLKNHVFRESKDRFQYVESQWNNTIEKLGSLDATKFIRYFWNANNDFTRTRTLYKTIRKNLVGEEKIERFVRSLNDIASVYSSILDPENTSYFNSYQLNEKLKDLSILGVTSYIPVILSLFSESYSEENILTILKDIENLIVRNLITAGLNPNQFELVFSKIAIKISKKGYETIDEIQKDLNKNKISDEQFERDFLVLKFRKSQKSRQRYFLRMLHSHNNKETRVISDNNIVHLEHILPIEAILWDIEEEVHEEYVNRLGNLTLLGQEYNKNASNKTFEYKKEIYAQSNIKMTKNLASYETWGPTMIEERQKEMAKLAIKIW